MSDEQVCRGCGHARVAHRHHRPGTDCALCPRDRFRLGPLARFLAWFNHR